MADTLTALVRRKGGVKDFGGELADMLGGKTVRKRSKTGKVFYSKSGRGIIRKRGMGLDDMRHIAIEEGFLPEGATVNDLLDALSDEARGRTRHSVQADYEAPKRVWEKRRKRRREKPTVPGHPSLTAKCKRCGRLHGKSAHRFHGSGSYVGTHKFLKYFEANPMLKNSRSFYVAIWGSVKRREELAFTNKLAAQRFLKKHGLKGLVVKMFSPAAKNPGGTSTRTEVRSPTSTETRALTRGNTTLTITGNGNRVRVPGGLKNPRGGVVIYHKLLRVEAQKGPRHRCDVACKRADHSYFHDFKEGAVVYGMPDGSLVIRSNTGKRLWNFF